MTGIISWVVPVLCCAFCYGCGIYTGMTIAADRARRRRRAEQTGWPR